MSKSPAALFIIGLIVYLVGAIWNIVDKKKGGHDKAPNNLRIIGALMMAIYFFIYILKTYN